MVYCAVHHSGGFSAPCGCPPKNLSADMGSALSPVFTIQFHYPHYSRACRHARQAQSEEHCSRARARGWHRWHDSNARFAALPPIEVLATSHRARVHVAAGRGWHRWHDSMVDVYQAAPRAHGAPQYQRCYIFRD